MRKNIYLKVLAFALILGVPALLFLGAIYDILSPREWASGMLAWVAIVLLWAVARKRAAKKTVASSEEHGTAIDDDARRRILRAIRTRKICIGVLALCFPFGIANAFAHHAYLPLLSGGAMSLLIMYVATEDIKRLRKRLGIDAKS